MGWTLTEHGWGPDEETKAQRVKEGPLQVAEGARPADTLIPDSHDNQTIVCCFKTPSLWFFVMGPPQTIHRVWLDLTGFQRARPEAAGVQQIPCSLRLNPKPVFPSGIPAPAFKGILCMARLCGWLGQTQPWTQLRSETSAFGGNQHTRLINDGKAAREALRVPWV